MKPFYYDKFLVEMNYEEACRLRVAVDHMRWMYDELEFKDTYEEWNKLYEDLTKIVEKIPF